MARFTKNLPADRATWTFGDLVYFHLLKFGTRPEGKPGDRSGIPWELDAVSTLLGYKSDRPIRNWMNDDNLPDSIVPLSMLLFEQHRRWDAVRAELQAKFESGWAARRAKGQASPEAGSAEATDAPETAPASTSPESETEAQPEARVDAAGSAEPEADGRGPEPSVPEVDAKTEAEPDGRANAEAESERAEHTPSEPEPASASEDRQSDAKPSPETHREAERESTQPIVLHSPEPSPGSAEARRKRVIVTGIAASLVVVVGAFSWLTDNRPVAPPIKVAVNNSPPASTVPPQRQVTSPPARTTPIATPTVVPAPQPPVAKPEPPLALPSGPVAQSPVGQPTKQDEPPKQKTEDEKRADEQEALTKKLVAARQAAFEADQKRIADEARARDTQNNNARDRTDEARQLAGLGFRLTENMSVPGTSFAHTLVESVADCALACTRQGCDAFGFFRDRQPPSSRAKRYCYLYRKPFAEPDNHPGYVLGVPVTEMAAPEPKRNAAVDALVIRVQATAPADDLAQCSSGPVKATGFNLSCDEILGGGTAPGGQERFAVSTINDCAAKCRPNKSCTGFTFNSGDPAGRRACQLFGGRPEGRESLGWISGRR